MKNQIKTCKQCGSSYIVNKKYQLCLKCNNMRLHGSIYGNQYKYPPNNKNPLKKAKKYQIKPFSNKSYETIKKDEETYEKVFNNSNHRCEECGKRLNEFFRDEDGKVACRWRYSHILTKKAFPEHRHNPLNFNNLCFDHHQEWEFGVKENMKIYENNLKIIEMLKNGKRN